MSRIQATARVQLTVEVSVGSAWGDDCNLSQVFKQGAEEARNHLINSLKPGEHGRIRIIGEPKVTGVITESP